VERKTIKQYLEGGKGKDKGIVVPVFFLNWAPHHEGVLGE
jgi:hypothetical protein